MVNILTKGATTPAPQWTEEGFDMAQCEKPYDEIGASYLYDMNRLHRPGLEWAIAQIPDVNPKSILDIGYGGGIVSRLILRRFPNAKGYGIDYSDVSYEYSQQYNKYFIDEGRLKLILGDVHDMPYEDGRFDFIISNASYIFWKDLAETFKEVTRVLAKGGTICLPKGRKVTDENYEELRAKLTEPVNLYKDEEIISMLDAAGADVKVFYDETGEHGVFLGTKR